MKRFIFYMDNKIAAAPKAIFDIPYITLKALLLRAFLEFFEIIIASYA